mgnify:CR=1 FL=1
MKISLIFFSLAFSALVNAEQVLSGNWEGFYSGSTNAIGSINITIDKPGCFIEMSDINKVTKLPFLCDSLRFEKGVFIFSTRKSFTDSKDWIETRYQLALSPIVAGSKIPRTLIGTWLQGMVKKDQPDFVALNSGTLKVKERLAD